MIPKGPRFLPGDDCLVEYERAVFVVAQRRVLRALFGRGEPVSISVLMGEVNISINALGAVYLRLVEGGYISFSDQGLSLTSSGRLWVMKNRKEIFMQGERVGYRVPTKLSEISGKRLEGRSKLPVGYLFSRVDNGRGSR